jgi:hypothetical protein
MQSDAGVVLLLLLLASPPFVLLHYVRLKNLFTWPSALALSIILPAVPWTALLAAKVFRFFILFEASGPMILILLAAPLFFLAGLYQSVVATLGASSNARAYSAIAIIMNATYCALVVVYFMNFTM